MLYCDVLAHCLLVLATESNDRRLDVQAEDALSELIVIQLVHVDAGKVATKLKAILPRNMNPRIATGDEKHTLIVRASRGSRMRIKVTGALFDVELGQTLVPLEHARAYRVSPILQFTLRMLCWAAQNPIDVEART